MKKREKKFEYFSQNFTWNRSDDSKNKNLCDKVFSFFCAFQSLRKRTPKKYLKKTILNELCAKKRPILVQKVSSQPILGFNEVKIKYNLYSIDIIQCNSVTQRLYFHKHKIFILKNEVLFQKRYKILLRKKFHC